MSGEWVGGLGHGGETIFLMGSNETVLSEVSYRSDGVPGRWPQLEFKLALSWLAREV